MAKVDPSLYVPTDDFFGAPYVDVDEERETPIAHRYLHGGFEGTDTRFAIWFPPRDRWQGRAYQPLEGANAGHEEVFAGPLGVGIGGLEMTLNRLGGYMVESNMGHIGDVMDAKAGLDPAIYGWRAAAESARFSKFAAEQVLGAAPHHSYVWGGSGGARRSPLCLAYAPDVWDGALPFMGDALDGEYGDFSRLRTFAQHFCSMFNVQRVLGPKVYDVIDSTLPGGDGDPFQGLDTHQREELATLYRLGYPRGDEFMIAQPMGQIWLWSSYAERLQRDYPEYWEAFWTKPGHVGFDQPEHVRHDLIDTVATVVRPLYAKDLAEDPQFKGHDYAQLRGMAAMFAGMNDMWDIPMALELDHVPDGYRLGTGIRMLSGSAAGRQLFALQAVGNVFLCDGEGEASNLRFSGVAAGDEVHVDNHAFLAYCYAYRHHLTSAEVDYSCLRADGRPIYPQYQIPEMSPFMGTVHTGRFEGKMMWVHHTHDASLWPSQGIGMKRNVERERGADADKYFCIRWTENAEHVVPSMAASPPGRRNNTWLVDYQPVIEQCLVDLTTWVEEGVQPAASQFEYKDGRITLPATAGERGGIQPVVKVEANGSSRAEVRVGEEVSLRVQAEVPPSAGTVVAVRWDFDGSGTYPFAPDLDGRSAAVDLITTHSWDRPGTYFATALVESHREGDVQASARRVPNLAQARIVVS